MRIAIVGFGREGRSVLRFLRRTAEYRRAEITILDRTQGPQYLRNLAIFDLVIKTPGIPFHTSGIQKALKQGVVFSSATQLFFEHKKGMVIGITGTKGKGTVATLLFQMLKSCGKRVFLAGNVGVPMLNILPKLTKNSIIILELSSFQLDRLPYSPHIAVALEVFPDHLDWHGSFAEYVRAKAYITQNQKHGDSAFFFEHNAESKKIAQQSRGRKIAVRPDIFSLFHARDLKIPGHHNFKNAVMAASVALFLGCRGEVVQRVVTRFRGLPQRLQLVGIVNGVRFYNDSASTNPYAASAAVQAFEEPFVLIAGGRDKGRVSHAPLAKVLKGSAAMAVVLFGENKARVRHALKTCGVRTVVAGSLEAAVRRAVEFAPIVVFSPGAASFDMFKDSKERGVVFNKIVKAVRI